MPDLEDVPGLEPGGPEPGGGEPGDVPMSGPAGEHEDDAESVLETVNLRVVTTMQADERARAKAEAAAKASAASRGPPTRPKAAFEGPPPKGRGPAAVDPMIARFERAEAYFGPPEEGYTRQQWYDACTYEPDAAYGTEDDYDYYYPGAGVAAARAEAEQWERGRETNERTESVKNVGKPHREPSPQACSWHATSLPLLLCPPSLLLCPFPVAGGSFVRPKPRLSHRKDQLLLTCPRLPP